MINDYLEGGLKMIDIQCGSLKATWPKRYLDKENCGSQKRFFDLEVEKYGGEVLVTLTRNLDMKDSRNIIKASDPFFKEFLEIWSEANYEEKIVSYYHFWSSPLWHNSLIRVGVDQSFLEIGSSKE